MKHNIESKLLAALPESITSKFAFIDDERDSGDGMWAYCIDGYVVRDLGCHLAHEWTVRDLIRSMKTVEPCTDSRCDCSG